MRISLISLFAVFVIGLIVLPSSGIDAETRETATVQIPVVDDTFVDKNQPDSNFGTNTQIMVGKGTFTEFCYLKFDISPIPKGTHIVSVELKLFCWEKAGLGEILFGREELLDEHGWNESTLTYSLLEEIAESYGASIGGFIGGYTTLDFSDIEEWSVFEVNFTDSSFPDVLEETRGNDVGQVTMHINLWSGDGELTLCSKEIGSEIMRPTMVVTYEKIPTTLSLQPIQIDVTEGAKVEIWGTTGVEPSYSYLEKWLPIEYLEGVVITLEYEATDSSGHMDTFERRVTTGSTGEFVDEFTPTLIGEYHVTASLDGTDTYSSVISDEIQFNVLESIDWKSKFYNTMNLTYLFIASTIILIATTVYFALRKPKTKP